MKRKSSRKANQTQVATDPTETTPKVAKGGGRAEKGSRLPMSSKNFKRRRRPGEIPTAMAAIRNFCLECSGYSAEAVRSCQVPECPKYPLRFGVKPGTAMRQGEQVDFEAADPAGTGPKAAKGRKRAMKPGRVRLSPKVIKRPRQPGEMLAPAAAIRSDCLACMSCSPEEVRLCTAPKCWPYPWRFGERPDTAARHGERVDFE